MLEPILRIESKLPIENALLKPILRIETKLPIENEKFLNKFLKFSERKINGIHKSRFNIAHIALDKYLIKHNKKYFDDSQNPVHNRTSN